MFSKLNSFSSDQTGLPQAVLLTLLIIVACMFIASRTSLWDRDEPELARAAVEMLQSGNYLYPTFNGEIWPEKPILVFWLNTLSIKLFGQTAFACRFWDTIGTGIACFLTFLLARRLFNPQVGLWAMLILATTLMTLAVGTMAIIDPILLPLQIAALLIFTHPVTTARRLWPPILLGIVLGLGMLAKGPIGLLPLPVIALMLWANRKAATHLWRPALNVAAACLIALLIFAAWAIPADNAAKGLFLRSFFGREVLSRAVKPMEHHGGSFLLYLFYYLPVIIVGFFPWILHLPGTISAVLGRRLADTYARTLLISWACSIFILMSLAATKLPHYIIFIWPAFAIAVAAAIDAARRNLLNDRDRLWLQRGGWFFVPVAAGASIGLILLRWFIDTPGLLWPALTSALILAATTVIAMRHQYANRLLAASRALVAGMLIFQIPFQLGAMPALEHIKLTIPIADAITRHTTGDTPVAAYRFNEPSLNFYVNRHIENLRGEQALLDWSRLRNPGVLVIPRSILADIEQRHEHLALHELASKKGINYSKNKELELVALLRGPASR